LLWAFATAEVDFSNPEMQPIFADIRDVVSSNLKKLLRTVPMPTDADLEEAEEPRDR
jgi:hypothetical protein